MARGKTVSRMVETNEQGGALGRETDLRSESGPETLAAPSNLSRQALDPSPSTTGQYPPPGECHFGVDRPRSFVSNQRSLRNREPVLPRPGSAQSLLGSHGVAPPEVIER